MEPSEPSGPGGTPGRGEPPRSGLAIAGVVASVLCCTPVGLGLTIGGHAQVRTGTRTGRGVVVAGYVVAAVVTVAMVAAFAISLLTLRSESEGYVGDWRTGGELRSLSLHITAPSVGATIEGSFEERRSGARCAGSILETDRDGSFIEVRLDGSCEDGSDVDDRIELRIGKGGDTLVTDDGRELHRDG